MRLVKLCAQQPIKCLWNQRGHVFALCASSVCEWRYWSDSSSDRRSHRSLIISSVRLQYLIGSHSDLRSEVSPHTAPKQSSHVRKSDDSVTLWSICPWAIRHTEINEADNRARATRALNIPAAPCRPGEEQHHRRTFWRDCPLYQKCWTWFVLGTYVGFILYFHIVKFKLSIVLLCKPIASLSAGTHHNRGGGPSAKHIGIRYHIWWHVNSSMLWNLKFVTF